MAYQKSQKTRLKFVFAGGSLLAALALLLNPQGLLTQPAAGKDLCQEVVQPKAVLSRDQLSRLLAIPERSSKEKLRQVMEKPYCKLQNIQVRTGGTAQREAYPLAFDPETWLVVLYEGEEYAGYSFSFQH